jgi:perosamine synthetase
MIPYGRQCIDEDDIRAVVEVLRSDWITTGPKVQEFEDAFARCVGSDYAVAVSSGTAALHAAMFALDIGPGDEVIVPPMTFAATANCIVYMGGMPVFVDVQPGTLLIDPQMIEKNITTKTRAIIGVDYTGHPCEWDDLRKISRTHNLKLVADACHSLGAEYRGRKVGTLADLNVFSFHPVKHITTGEGGMITTNDSELADRMRIFRNHGIASDHRQREKMESWFYEMTELGYNYRITDIQCALGISQLRKLPDLLSRRREIARSYDAALSRVPGICPLDVHADVMHSYHLYVVRLDKECLGSDRSEVFSALRTAGIGVNVHYVPVHLHPFYRRIFGTSNGMCPIAEAAYHQILTLPIFPSMSSREVDYVIQSLSNIS